MSAGILELLCEQGKSLIDDPQVRLLVGMGTCGRAAGAGEVLGVLKESLHALDGASMSGLSVEPVGCKGLCYAEPLVEVCVRGAEPLMLGHVDAEAARVLAELVLADDPLAAIAQSSLSGHIVDGTVLAMQERRVMSNCGEISPMSIAQYVARGGYAALASALGMKPSQVIDTVCESGLRGRGGAGFPTGEKWRACTCNDSKERYFIVNADEGDPGAYMDRGLLESDPHRVLEGLIIGCYATGAHQAYFFVRAEYPLAVRTFERALADAREAGFIGRDILGSGFDLDIGIVRGAGAFLCGESTAMVNVLENGECTTRPKPPHLAEKGLWGKPTCVNNVETLACVPLVMQRGAEWFRQVGTAESPGTKIFSVTGGVERGGLVEVPLGTSLRTIVSDISGARDAKAVQIGGPSGAILPVTLGDMPISYEALEGVNGMMGSGGFVVIGQNQCVVDTASYLVHFSARQSCRKCKPCREGLDECAAIFERLCAGQGAEGDLGRLQQIAERNCSSKLCGLGRTSLSPVLSSLHYFRDEYEAHLTGVCPGLTCQELVSYIIDEAKCQGERCCLLTCPGNAVKGRFGKPGRIVERLCQKCGMCMVTCPYSAVRKVSP